MSLDALPNELFLMIAKSFKKERQINRLARTNRHLYTLLNPYLYTRNALFGKSFALPWAAQNGKLQTALHSLKYGGDVKTLVKSKSTKYATPLTLAAEAGHEEIVRLLLEHGGDPNATHRYSTPLTLAAEAGREEIVRLLLEYGADPNTRRGEVTPLTLAAEAGREEIVRLLLKYGADPNAKHRFSTPLTLAMKAKKEEIVRLLLEHGADPNAKHVAYKVPLWLAVQNDDHAIAKLLLGNGAHPDPVNCARKTPLFIAAASGSSIMAELLLLHGANPNQETRSGRTPLHAAIMPGEEFVYLGGYREFRGNKYAKTGEVIRVLLEHGARPWALLVSLLKTKYPHQEDQAKLLLQYAPVPK